MSETIQGLSKNLSDEEYAKKMANSLKNNKGASFTFRQLKGKKCDVLIKNDEHIYENLLTTIKTMNQIKV